VRKKILLVDDADLFLQLEKMIFQRTGAEILTARTGKQAINAALSEHPDIILLDLRLTDMPGDEVCATIKAHPATSSIPILIVTAFGKVEEMDRCRRAGCDDFVPKPVKNQELLAKVATMLRIPHRHSLRILVRIETEGTRKNDVFFGTSADLSKSGMFLETDQKLIVGEEINVRFFLPNQEEIEAKSKVVREESRGRTNGYGIQFQELSSKQEKALAKFIDTKHK
jgi:DNA-binding response OmpR family regulator